MCSNCYSLQERYGTTVGGLVSAGDAVARSNPTEARNCYTKALKTLDELGGCSSCKQELKQKINLTY